MWHICSCQGKKKTPKPETWNLSQVRNKGLGTAQPWLTRVRCLCHVYLFRTDVLGQVLPQGLSVIGSSLPLAQGTPRQLVTWTEQSWTTRASNHFLTQQANLTSQSSLPGRRDKGKKGEVEVRVKSLVVREMNPGLRGLKGLAEDWGFSSQHPHGGS